MAIDICFVMLPNALVLDWSGPSEAFRMANKACLEQGLVEPFQLRFIASRSRLPGSVGCMLADLEPLPENFKNDTWLVVVGLPSGYFKLDDSDTSQTIDWLRGLKLDAKSLRLITICAGALVAAAAGLLAGEKVTTHHQCLDELKRIEPRCDVQMNRVFVEGGKVWSSAGVTTGIDLALHLIAKQCGAAIAAQVAKAMVVALRRDAQDPELSPFLNYRDHMHPSIHRLQDAIAHTPTANWSVPKMARVACVSERHLARLFLVFVGISPLDYVRSIRLALAQLAIDSGSSVTQAALSAGFTSDTQFRRTRHFFKANK